MRVLIAEDEVSIAKALKSVLERNNFTVDMVHDGAEALFYIREFDYDALVLDIMMPEIDGLEVLKTVRAEGNGVPALFLTAKGEVEDRVAGLEAGADDYLPKPFATGEFVARVKALTRRSGTYRHEVRSLGKTELDSTTYTLSRGEKSCTLNNKEFQLMDLFITHPGQIFSSQHLMDKVWDLDTDAGIGVVWTYIGFLRKKLKEIDSDIEIKTIRGAGYALEEIKD